MVVRIGVHRVNEGHLVDMRGQSWKQFTHPRAALAVLRPCERRFHQGPHRIGKETGLRIEARQWLTVPLLQLWLEVPRIHMARSPVHEEPDHGFCRWRKIRRLWRDRTE